jgi:hypothetical protein
MPERGALLTLAVHPPQHRVDVHKAQLASAAKQLAPGASHQAEQEPASGGV